MHQMTAHGPTPGERPARPARPACSAHPARHAWVSARRHTATLIAVAITLASAAGARADAAAVPTAGEGPPGAVLAAWPIGAELPQPPVPTLSADGAVSADGTGAWRSDSDEARVLTLFQHPGPQRDGVVIWYQARLRTLEVTGPVYLEMWATFPQLGSFFSRPLDQAITGTTDGWVTQRTPFYLEPGQVPSQLLLNLRIDGPGTVWIDDVTLSLAPLPQP